MNHVRADRWYKFGRTILYGRLEDEAPFQRVRRLVAVRGLHAAPGPRRRASTPPSPYGIVEMTPEREYLLVTEFFDGAAEIGEAEVDDDVIDQGLVSDPSALGRRPGPPRHQAGQPAGARRASPAHRRRLRAGPTVAVAPGRRPGQHDARPRGADRSPSGLRAGRLRLFTPDDIAEAFAATRASPARHSCARDEARRPRPGRRSSGRWPRRADRSRSSAGASAGVYWPPAVLIGGLLALRS